MSTDSDRVLAPGVPLTLADGREVRVRFGMRALKMVEDEFGSISEVSKYMTYNSEGEATGKAITAVWFLLRAGLSRLKLSEDELDDLLDPSRIQVYIEVIEKAFAQAFPAAVGKVEGSQDGSPGPTSTTSAPSSLDGVTALSGR